MKKCGLSYINERCPKRNKPNDNGYSRTWEKDGIGQNYGVQAY